MTAHSIEIDSEWNSQAATKHIARRTFVTNVEPSQLMLRAHTDTTSISGVGVRMWKVSEKNVYKKVFMIFKYLHKMCVLMKYDQMCVSRNQKSIKAFLK